MKKQSTMTLMLMLLSAFFYVRCSTDELIEVFVPNISNQWESSRNTKFFFVAAQDSVSESTLTGNEQDENFETFDLEGSYKNYDVEFTFTSGPEDGVKYTGKFLKNSNPLQMKVTGTNGQSITITRIP